jgi:hypothetical protein
MARATGLIAAMMFAGLGMGNAFAQEVAAAPAPELKLELNALQKSDAGCRITFLATNDLGKALDKAAFEVALFNAEGGIERLVSLDFKALTAGKTKVLQFDLTGTQCEDVGRVLVNDVAACTGEGVEPGACLAGLKTDTKTKITFGL